MFKPLKSLFACLWLLALTNPAITQTRQDPPADQHYDLSYISKEGRGGPGVHYMANGPAGEAEDCDLVKGLTIDGQGNCYYTNSSYAAVRCYSKSKGKVFTVAGGAKGYLDGPVSRARFGGWGYCLPALPCVSDDGKHLFIKDQVNKLWRYIDLEGGMVSTVGSISNLVIAKDCFSGNIYAFMRNGTTPPDCKGYTKLTVPSILGRMSIGFNGVALDVSKMKLYCHYRGPSWAFDLTNGDSLQLTDKLWCPVGMSISQSGRYLYIGGGDDFLCWRKDLTTGELTALGRSKAAKSADGFDAWFKVRDADHALALTNATWPGEAVFSLDGSYGLWSTRAGLLMMTPRN